MRRFETAVYLFCCLGCEGLAVEVQLRQGYKVQNLLGSNNRVSCGTYGLITWTDSVLGAGANHNQKLFMQICIGILTRANLNGTLPLAGAWWWPTSNVYK